MSLSQYKYYLGSKVSGPYAHKSGKATIHYQVVASWHSTGRSHTVRCKLSTSMGGSHEEGVEVTELERFTETVGHSIGVEGIAALKSDMESATEIQVAWQKRKTNTDTFNIPGPECGSQTWGLFQLVRDYRFIVETRGWFGRSRFHTTELREKTFHYDMLVQDDPDDPACPCPKFDRDKGEILSLLIDRLGMRLDAFLADNNQYRFRIGPKTYAVDAAAVHLQPVTLTLEDAPQIIRELSGIGDATIQAQVDVAEILDRTDLWSTEGLSPLVRESPGGQTKGETP